MKLFYGHFVFFTLLACSIHLIIIIIIVVILVFLLIIKLLSKPLILSVNSFFLVVIVFQYFPSVVVVLTRSILFAVILLVPIFNFVKVTLTAVKVINIICVSTIILNYVVIFKIFIYLPIHQRLIAFVLTCHGFHRNYFEFFCFLIYYLVNL